MKKYLLNILLIIFLSVNISICQWSTEPNNNLIVGYGEDPHICSDIAGGCYITYNNNISYPRELALERIDKYGYKPWGTKKQILGELPEQWQAEIVEDGEGGVIVSYQDNQIIGGTDFTSRVRVQRVDSNGNFLWDQTGVRVTLSETNQGSNLLVSDGEGGCVVVWQYYDGIFGINRINMLGQRVWSDFGILLAPTGTSLRIIRSSDGKYYVQVGTNIFRLNQNGEIINQYSTTLGQMVPDPEGGVVLSNKVWTGMIPKLVAQRKDSLGNNLWQEPYVEIADSIGLGSFRIGVNDRIINYAWLGRYDSSPYYQAINLEGNLIYQNKILLSDDPSGTTLIGIISSYYNNTIFSWSISGEINSIIAQMYDTLGNKIWGENGVIITHPRLTYQQYITDGRGGFVTAGLINTFTVAAQQVSKYGNLGEIISVPVELVSFTGDATKDKIILNWLTATELNNSGFEIERQIGNPQSAVDKWIKIGFVPGFGTTTEPKTYSFTDNNVSSGIYKYRLKQIDFDGSFEYSNEIAIEAGFMPNGYALFQNYPNPFNPSTQIKFSVPKQTQLKINLYNVIGELVKTITEGLYEAGYHQTTLDAHNLPSGIYIYRLESNDLMQSRKMIILK